jgi:hypothetical protein
MLNERKLSPEELSKREQIIMGMKKNKISLVKKFGADAEKVMYGRATNIAKKQSETREEKLKEAVRSILSTPPTSNISELTELIFSKLRNKK